MLLGTAGCMDNMTLDGAEALHRLRPLCDGVRK